jgi:uncharacterized protein (DUF433 family)
MAVRKKTMVTRSVRRVGENEVQVSVLQGVAPQLPARPNSQVAPITVNPQKVHGIPTIAGSRTPVAALLDYLARGGTVAKFVDDYDGVTAEECVAALIYLREAVEELGLGEQVDY